LIEHGCLENLKQELLDNFAKQNYPKDTIKNYRTILNRLERYMVENGYSVYTAEVGATFLEYKRHCQQYSQAYMNHMAVVVRRVNEFIGGENFNIVKQHPEALCLSRFSAVFDRYLDRLRLVGYREGTIRFNKRHCLNMLAMFAEEGIIELSEIKPANIYRYIEHAGDKPRLPSPLRSFFNYLYKENITEHNLSLIIPSIRKPRPIPSVYTSEEMGKFLSAFDRSTFAGKRDYAIALLALKLGLRSCDIVNLKISDVNFKTKKINFVQVKTLVPQSLELLPEIEDALTSYLSFSRPDIAIPNIFLTIRAPIRKLRAHSVHHVTSTHLKKAGIAVGDRKQGGHSLRMTFASELVQEKIPYEAVRKILGQDHPASAKKYVKFDTEQLRHCAIETPKISGKLGMLIDGITGGA